MDLIDMKGRKGEGENGRDKNDERKTIRKDLK